MTILQVLLRLLPTHSCVIYIVYSFNIAYERGMVVVVLPQVSVFDIQILRSEKNSSNEVFSAIKSFVIIR